MKLKGVFGVPAIEEATGKEYVRPIPEVVIIFKSSEGVMVSFETDTFGAYSVDVPEGEYNVQAYVKGNKQTIGYIRQGVHFQVTNKTNEKAFDEWIRIDTINTPDPLLAQWTQLLKDIEKQRTEFANDIKDVVGVVERESEPAIQNAIARVKKEADAVKVDVNSIITSSQESMDTYLLSKKTEYDKDLANNIATSKDHLSKVTTIKTDIEKLQKDINTANAKAVTDLASEYSKHSKALTTETNNHKKTLTSHTDTLKVVLTEHSESLKQSATEEIKALTVENTNTHTAIQKLLEEANQLNITINDTGKTAVSNIDKAKKESISSIESSKSTVIQAIDIRHQEFLENHTELMKETNVVFTRLESLSSNVDKELDKVFNSVKAKEEESLLAITNAQDNSVKAVKAEESSSIKKITEETDKQLIASKQSIDTLAKTKEDSLTELSNTEVAKVLNESKALQETIVSNKVSVEEISKAVEDANTTLSQAVDKVLSEEFYPQKDIAIQALQTESNKILENFKTDLSNESTKVVDASKLAINEESSKALSSITPTIDAKLQEATASLNASLESSKIDLNSEKDKHIVTIKSAEEKAIGAINTASQIAGYATQEFVLEKVSTKADTTELSKYLTIESSKNLITKEELSEAVNAVDLSNYPTKEETTSEIATEIEATKEELNGNIDSAFASVNGSLESVVKDTATKLPIASVVEEVGTDSKKTLSQKFLTTTFSSYDKKINDMEKKIVPIRVIGTSIDDTSTDVPNIKRTNAEITKTLSNYLPIYKTIEDNEDEKRFSTVISRGFHKDYNNSYGGALSDPFSINTSDRQVTIDVLGISSKIIFKEFVTNTNGSTVSGVNHQSTTKIVQIDFSNIPTNSTNSFITTASKTDKNGFFFNGKTPIDTLTTSDMADTVVDNDTMTVTSGAIFRAISKFITSDDIVSVFGDSTNLAASQALAQEVKGMADTLLEDIERIRAKIEAL